MSVSHTPSNDEPVVTREIARELAIDKLVRLILEEEQRKGPLPPSLGSLQREHSFYITVEELME